ncbi:hypothetical protein EXU48_13665 [Occultella glacieicola]|uniref:DUF2993 domain-containing protein n=1 Tax=Occultella glacieicola TaxID=2518684 RepID=A0ABY2E3Z3_9MICO|nr:hypothetical protein [Occultella glacieicola]TDE92588.1 hypothetical protein EXU48_13665 [Occultella glacieicola]
MFLLGPGPVPTTSEELERRLAAGLRELMGLAANTPIQVTASLADHGSIPSVRIDLSGVQIRTSGSARNEPTFTDREPVLLGELHVSGSPISAEGVPLTAAAQVRNLPLAWRHTTDGDLWLWPDEEAGSEVTPDGHAEASAVLADVTAALKARGAAALVRRGFTLKDLTLDVRATTPKSATLRAEATVGKSILSAKAVLTGEASFDETSRMTVRNLKLTSGNPLVAALLTVAKRYTDEWDGRTVDLAQYAFAGARVRDVSISTEAGVVRVTASAGA